MPSLYTRLPICTKRTDNCSWGLPTKENQVWGVWCVSVCDAQKDIEQEVKKRDVVVGWHWESACMSYQTDNKRQCTHFVHCGMLENLCVCVCIYMCTCDRQRASKCAFRHAYSNSTFTEFLHNLLANYVGCIWQVVRHQNVLRQRQGPSRLDSERSWRKVVKGIRGDLQPTGYATTP